MASAAAAGTAKEEDGGIDWITVIGGGISALGGTIAAVLKARSADAAVGVLKNAVSFMEGGGVLLFDNMDEVTTAMDKAGKFGKFGPKCAASLGLGLMSAIGGAFAVANAFNSKSQLKELETTMTGKLAEAVTTLEENWAADRKKADAVFVRVQKAAVKIQKKLAKLKKKGISKLPEKYYTAILTIRLNAGKFSDIFKKHLAECYSVYNQVVEVVNKARAAKNKSTGAIISAGFGVAMGVIGGVLSGGASLVPQVGLLLVNGAGVVLNLTAMGLDIHNVVKASAIIKQGRELMGRILAIIDEIKTKQKLWLKFIDYEKNLDALSILDSDSDDDDDE